MKKTILIILAVTAAMVEPTMSILRIMMKMEPQQILGIIIMQAKAAMAAVAMLPSIAATYMFLVMLEEATAALAKTLKIKVKVESQALTAVVTSTSLGQLPQT